MTESTNVIVCLEELGGWGSPLNCGLLTEGARIAQSLGGVLTAVTIGGTYDEEAIPEDYGVSTHYRINAEGLSCYNAESYAWALSWTVKTVPFKLLLFADTSTGRDLAPRVAFALNTVAVLSCRDIQIIDNSNLHSKWHLGGKDDEPEAYTQYVEDSKDEANDIDTMNADLNKKIVYVRPVYGDQLEQDVSFKDDSHEIATIKMESLYIRKTNRNTPKIVDIPVVLPTDGARTKAGDSIAPDPETMDILYSKRIVGIGAGCAASQSQAEELAHLLGASIATTRPMVDDGLVPKTRMIGQTGKTVSPDAYLALGISGSPHHVAGIQQSKTILSINIDPRAPVFGFSDAGFVADVDTVLPKLIERIKRFRDEGRS
jgi:electron transfer flavoprotein alpha subunit